jgi:predicted MFS family arabinose efflux permease
VLVASDLAQAVLLASVPLAAFLGWLSTPLLFGFAFIAGLLSFVFGVARQSYVPSIVERAQLVRANSRITAGNAVAEAGAFAAGGWLVQLAGAPLALAIDGLSFLGSAFLLRGIETIEPAPAPRPRRERGIVPGLRAIAADPHLRAIALASSVVAFANETVGVVYVLFVRRDLGFAPGTLGMLFALGSIASLASSFAAERIGSQLGVRAALGLGLLLAAGAIATLASAPGANALGAAAIACQQLLGDFGMVIFQIHAVSLVQSLAPRELQSRVNGSIAFLASWSMLAGALGGGALGERFGARITLVAAAGGLLVAAALCLAIPRGTGGPRPDR